MRVEIRSGGDGVACWNGDAVRAYCGRATEREERLRSANPDLVVMEGQVKCYGCEVMEHGYGTRCTAVMTLTLYAVEGEIAPREADAKGSLLDIPGLVSKIDTPAELETHAPAAPAAAPNGSAPAGRSDPAPSVRGGLRRLIGR
jgi:hypothetical protein